MYMEYYPAAFAAFTTEDEQERSYAIRRMQEVWGAWQAAREIDLPCVRAAVDRSFMTGEVARLAFERTASDTKLQTAPPLRSAIASALYGVGHTAVIEDSFQRCRLRETRGASHSIVNPRSLWAYGRRRCRGTCSRDCTRSRRSAAKCPRQTM